MPALPTNPKSKITPKRPEKLYYLAGIILLGALAYANSLHNSFHFDDTLAIVNNPSIRSLGNLSQIWSFAPCRFIVILSFALNYQICQLNVFGYHLVNLFSHLATCAMVYWTIILTFSTPAMKEENISRRSGLIAFFAGLIFALHPVQTQAVNYIYQRAAVLAALFYLASLCFYVKYRLLEEEGLKRPWLYGVSLFFAIMAMFTKEMTITLPVMLCLYEYIFFNRADFNWKRLRPFLAAILIIPLTLLLTHSAPLSQIYSSTAPKWKITYWQYFVTEFRAMFTYLSLIFLLLQQRLDYDYPVSSSFFKLPVILSVAALLAIAYFTLKIRRNYRIAAFGLAWFFLTILPESSLMPLPEIVLEHRLYLPMAGFSLFFAAGLYYLAGEKRIKLMIIIMCIISSILFLLTYQRNQVWKDNLTLWTDSVRKSPQKAWLYYNRGNAYYDRGQYLMAIIDYDRALQIEPSLARAYYNRALAYSYLHSFARSIQDLDRSIELVPDYPGNYYSRALVYYEMNEYAKSRRDLLTAQSLGLAEQSRKFSGLKRLLDASSEKSPRNKAVQAMEN